MNSAQNVILLKKRMLTDALESTKIRFQIPWMREAFSHCMYHDEGYRCRISLEIEEIGKSNAEPALTAKENAQIAKLV